jgi:hypothetical protein
VPVASAEEVPGSTAALGTRDPCPAMVSMGVGLEIDDGFGHPADNVPERVRGVDTLGFQG